MDNEYYLTACVIILHSAWKTEVRSQQIKNTDIENSHFYGSEC